jgi:cytochrome c-type biogenesis protein CcmF
VRSGVLSSVHAFATDPARGIFILGFLAVVIGGSLLLFAWRAPQVGAGGSFELVSRESMLLANNVLLLVATAAVLLGTLYPLVIDALGLGKLSVGPPYFETVFVPIMAPALFLMGVGPLARWKRASIPELAVRLRWALGVSLALGFLSPFLFGNWSGMVGFGLALAIWIVLAAGLSLSKSVKQTRAHYGMVVAHIGVAAFVVGVTLVKGYESERDANVKPGESIALGAYGFKLESIREVKGPNYVAARATVSVTRHGKPVGVLHPERRIYTVQQQVMTEAAIDPGFTGDLYVSLGDPLPGGAWLVKVQHKPFIDWIWGGCLIMALGGLLAASDRRYRFAVKARRTAEVPA